MSKSTEKPHRLIVRVTTNFHAPTPGTLMRLTKVRVMRRLSHGHDFLTEDTTMVGADEVVPRIINLGQVRDGLYHVITVNEHRDRETGHVDRYDYKLVPFVKEFNAELIDFLNQNFVGAEQARKHSEEKIISYAVKDSKSKTPILWLCGSPMALRFSRPEDSMKKHLAQVHNGYYLPQHTPTAKAIKLVVAHKSYWLKEASKKAEW